jgi:hypothetical protein
MAEVFDGGDLADTRIPDGEMRLAEVAGLEKLFLGPEPSWAFRSS